MSQMAFHFDPAPSYEASNFVVSDNNRSAYDAIYAWPNWPAPAVVLVGPAGSGKTHLLQLWRLQSLGMQCSIHELRSDFNPTRYAQRPVAVDEVDRIAGNIDAERAMFHLYNLSLQNKQTLLLTAESHPQQWGLLLPDLASRIRAAIVVEISQPDEALIRQLYKKLFQDRQLHVQESVIDWLLARVERSAVTANHVVAALDHAALEYKKPVTIWLARKALGYGEEDGDDGDFSASESDAPSDRF